MRRRIVSGLVLGALVFAAGTPAGALARTASSPHRVSVVAAFYPLAWSAREIGGNRVQVTDLTPAGAEPHDLELTTDDRAAIESADLVIVLGGGFQPAVEDAVAQRDGPTLVVVDGFAAAQRARARTDPHVWLDPVLMRRIVDRTLSVLEHVVPGGHRALRAGHDAVVERLRGLDGEYRAGLATCARDLIVTSHEAFGWLASRYGLTQEAIAGIDPEAEPAPDRLAELASLARDQGVTTIFTEDLVSPKVAQTVAREAGGLRTQVLSPLESLNTEQRAHHDDYVSVMLANLKKLRTALGCR